jgi:anti-sigma B factor antagonist
VHPETTGRADDAKAAGPPQDARPSGYTARAGELEVTERDDGAIRIFTAAGELDLSTAPSLCLQLDAARRRAYARVLVDLSNLHFCDSTGLRALVLAAQEITASAGRFAVVVAPGDGAVARLFKVTGAAELVPLFQTLDHGVAFLRRP